MKFSLRAETIFAVGILIGFFLPWINLGGFVTVTGYQIPELLKGGEQLFAMVEQETDIRIKLAYFVLYLIPIMSGVTIIMNFANQNPRLPAFLAGVIPIIGFVYVLLRAISEIGSDIFQVLAIGAYITVICAIGIILAVFGDIRLPKQTQESPIHK